MPPHVTIAAETTIPGTWRPFRLYTLDVTRRDGTRQRQQREIYALGGSVAVLPFDAARGTVLLVRQWRLPAQLAGDDPMLIEAIAGHVDPGMDADGTAHAECWQEAGLRPRNLRRVLRMYSSPGTVGERLDLYLCDYTPADHEGAGGGLVEEGEEIEVLEIPLTEAWRLAATGGIVDAKTLLLIQHLILDQNGLTLPPPAD